MEIMTGIGWVAAIVFPAITPVGTMVTDKTNEFNTEFAQNVDAGNSCFDRVGGEVGSYSKPSDFSLDLVCNWRLKQVTKEGTYKEWVLERAI